MWSGEGEQSWTRELPAWLRTSCRLKQVVSCESFCVSDWQTLNNDQPRCCTPSSRVSTGLTLDDDDLNTNTEWSHSYRILLTTLNSQHVVKWCSTDVSNACPGNQSSCLLSKYDCSMMHIWTQTGSIVDSKWQCHTTHWRPVKKTRAGW